MSSQSETNTASTTNQRRRREKEEVVINVEIIRSTDPLSPERQSARQAALAGRLLASPQAS